MPTEPSFPVITEVPDENTSEAVMYGSKYLFAKGSKYFWDAVEDQLVKEIREYKARIRDPEYAAWVMRNNRNLPFFTSPPVDDPAKLKDLLTLKEIIKRGTGLGRVRINRKKNLMWARMHGIDEYTKGRMAAGISETEWKLSTISYDEPLDYDAIRTMIEHDDLVSVRDVEDIELDRRQFMMEADRLKREFDAYRECLDNDVEYIPDQLDYRDPVEDIRIQMEVEVEDELPCRDATDRLGIELADVVRSWASAVPRLEVVI